MPTAHLPGELQMYLVEVPGASGYVQHSAPDQCVAIWRDFVKAAEFA